MDHVTAERAPLHLRLIKYWFPVVAMLGVMYYFSTDVFSADNTRNVIEKIFLWFVPHASKHTMATMNYVVRKAAHFTEYAVLGAFLFRAYRADHPTRWRLKWAFYSFLTAGTWALLDEFHQTLTRSRGGSIWDSLIDSSGAFFVLAAIAIVYRTPRRREVQDASQLQASD